jgi:hypothetical protein
MEVSVDELLRAAIQQKRLIRVVYKGKLCVVEPHDYGVRNVSGYQVSGSSSGKLPNWRWVEVNSISDLDLLNRSNISYWTYGILYRNSHTASEWHKAIGEANPGARFYCSH